MKPPRLLLALAAPLLSLSLLACGSVSETAPDGGDDPGGDGGGGGDGDFSLSLAPGSVNVRYHESATVTISVTRSGDVGAITLSADDLPQGILVDFDSNPIPAGTSSTDATVTVEPGAAVGPTALTIAGSAGALERSETLDLTIEAMTVSGKVSGNRSNITVVLVGKSPVLSDAEGNFSFDDVVPPYDIYTVASGVASTPTVFYYEGLTRPDPVVQAATGFFAVFACLFPRSGTITGNLSGTGSATNRTVLAWTTGGQTSSINDVAAYAFPGEWCSSTTISGTLHGLQWTTKASSQPDVYTGFAQRDATLTNGGSSNLPLTMSAPASAAVTGTLAPPAGFPNPTVTLSQRLGTRPHILFGGVTQNLDTAVPLLAAGTAFLHARTASGGRETRYVFPTLDAATDVSFDLPAPPAQIGPANNASAVTHATPFQWTAPSNGVTSVQFTVPESAQSAGDGAAFRVITTAAQTTIPEVPEVPLPKNRAANWRVSSFGPLESVDDAASEVGLQTVPENGSFNVSGLPRFESVGTQRNFTTAP